MPKFSLFKYCKRKFIQEILLILILFELMTGCENDIDGLNRNSSKSISEQKHSLSDKASQSEEHAQSHHNPTALFDIHWSGVGNDNIVVNEKIYLVVKNISDIPFTASVNIISSGLLQNSAVLALGTYVFEPGEKKDFEVNAIDIPIQIQQGVGQLSADVRVKVPKPSGDVEWVAPISSIYYQHQSGYQSLETFKSMKALIDFKGGRLHGVLKGDENKDIELGRLKDTNGDFQSIRTGQSKQPGIYAASSSEGFIVTGMSVEIFDNTGGTQSLLEGGKNNE